MVLRGLLPVGRIGIQMFPNSFLARKASLQASASAGVLSSMTEKLYLASLSQKKAPIQHKSSVMSMLPTIGIPIKLPSVTERVNIEYQLPTLLVKNLIVNQDLPILVEKIDPLVNKWEIRNPNTRSIIRKEAARLIQIRRRKMKKHKLRKLRKRMRFVWDRMKYYREKRKENAFKEELYAQVKKAETFDAEIYVKDILHRINNKPHIETPEERKAKLRELIQKHRSNVTFMRPDYHDIK